MKPEKNVSAQGRHSIVPHKAKGISIRGSYKTYISVGMVLSLTLLIIGFRAPLYPSQDGFNVDLVQQEVVQMEDIVQTEQIMKPPPPPRPPQPVEVPNDEVLDEDFELDLDATLDIDEPMTDLPPPPPTPKAEEVVVEEPEPEIFVVVEQMPEIIGGTAKIYEVLEYPTLARQAGMEGLVVVQLVVNTQGNPMNLEIARSAGAILDEAALKAVNQLKFKPGLQRGQPVLVRMALPIRFRLKSVEQ